MIAFEFAQLISVFYCFGVQNEDVLSLFFFLTENGFILNAVKLDLAQFEFSMIFRNKFYFLSEQKKSWKQSIMNISVAFFSDVRFDQIACICEFFANIFFIQHFLLVFIRLILFFHCESCAPFHLQIKSSHGLYNSTQVYTYMHLIRTQLTASWSFARAIAIGI